jgi:D-amino-acid dehydrogenase
MVRADTLEGDAVVLAGGVWTRDLGAQVGLPLPLIAGKGYSMTLDAPVSLPEVCSILVEGRVAVTPMGGQLRVGGTMEIGGAEGKIDPRRVEAIADSFCEFVPGFSRRSFDGQAVWHGLRPCSPDGLPYLGRHGRYVVAAGHAMMGLSLAPATGIVVRELVEGRPSTVSLEAFSPARFASSRSR